MPLLCAGLCRWFVLCLFCLQATQQLQNGIPCFLLDLLLALLPDFRLQQLFLQTCSGGLHGLEELVQHGVQMVGGIFPRGLRSLAFRGERSSEAAGSAAILRQIIPGRICRTASYHWARVSPLTSAKSWSRLSARSVLQKAGGLLRSPQATRTPLHSCSGQAALQDSSSGFSEGHFDPLILANCQPDTSPTPLYGAFLVNRCVRAYRESRLLRTHVRSKTPKFSFIGGIKNGSCPPAIGGEVGLHKGFDAHKAPDSLPGRVDDVVDGFQIVPALVGDQRIAESSGLDRIQAVLLAPHLVDLIQLFRAGAGILLQIEPCQRELVGARPLHLAVQDRSVA